MIVFPSLPYYDLLTIDIGMPFPIRFELDERILKIDISSKLCFITAFDVYCEGLMAEYVILDFTCFTRKPISI